MEFMQFIFSSFWVWLGFTILLSAAGGFVVELMKTGKRNRKVSVERIGQRLFIEVEGASAEDVRTAVMTASFDACNVVCEDGRNGEQFTGVRWSEDDE